MVEPMIGERIRALRERDGVSQAALARRLDASTMAINFLENGTTKAPHIDRLIALAQFFRVSLDYLVGLTDVPTPPPPRPTRQRTPRTAAPHARDPRPKENNLRPHHPRLWHPP